MMLLRPTLPLRETVYGWMTTPGIVEQMMGPPTYPENPVPSLEEFCRDWTVPHWTHEAPERGRLFLMAADGDLVGCIAQNEVVTAGDGRRAAELDMWLARPELVGRGYGRRAITALCDLIARDLAVKTAFLQPSARNVIACRSYAAARFVPAAMGVREAAAFFRTEPDYPDSVFYVKSLG
jgi:RimJ/RimL family protein N-acetyltransferase